MLYGKGLKCWRWKKNSESNLALDIDISISFEENFDNPVVIKICGHKESRGSILSRKTKQKQQQKKKKIVKQTENHATLYAETVKPSTLQNHILWTHTSHYLWSMNGFTLSKCFIVYKSQIVHIFMLLLLHACMQLSCNKGRRKKI